MLSQKLTKSANFRKLLVLPQLTLKHTYDRSVLYDQRLKPYHLSAG